MIHTIDEFERLWGHEGTSTLKIMRALSDASLSQAVAPQDRTLGRVAWHVVQSIEEMMGRTGLKVAGPGESAPVPGSAKEIADTYEEVSNSLMEQIKGNWNDATLMVEDDMYGEKWKRGLTLAILAHHQIHHRAQMTVLMRQAGLKVPGVYGPAREEWAEHGMPAPEV